MNHYLCSQFHAAVDFMVNIVEQVPAMPGFSGGAYLQEMRTVHANAGRRCGKGQYVLRRARLNDVVVFISERLANLGRKPEANLLFADIPLDQQLLPLLDGRTPVGRVYVDEPHLVFKTFDKGQFYEAMARCGAKTVVLLGE